MIIDHDNPAYRERWKFAGAGKFNGAFFYSREIVKNIIPRVRTDRNWITINQPGEGVDHSIVFIHNNKNPEHYDWLAKYKDLILVCGVPETCQKVAHLGKTVYLPLSVDVAYVERFKRPKIADTAYVGRLNKMQGTKLPKQVLCLSGLTRTRLLTAMAQYKRVYAVGRCAIEARILDCEILPYDPRFPDPDFWQVLDNKDAAKILQKELDKIDCKSVERRKKLVIDTSHPRYIEKRASLKSGQFNGAFYYSQEIVKNIIPKVKTKRPWDTLGMKSIGTFDHAIVFIHHNINMDRVYAWLKDYDDLVLVTSTPYTYEWAIKAGYKAINVPLSIDTKYVKKFKTKKTKDTCFCGNIWSFRKEEIASTIPDDVDFQPKNICREELLKFMAPYRKVYAIGRCALEAKCLGAEILQCYKKFDVEHWELKDNSEVVGILQKELDKIDG